jgi:plastocyanin
MSEHEEVKANKRALAVVSVAGILLAISITSVLLVPGLQPRYIAAPPPGGVPSGGPGPEMRAGAEVFIVAPSGSGIAQINFAPANIVLIIGFNNTLVLKNEDSSDHTITSNPGDSFSFDTGDISGLSTSFPIVFNSPGTYGYHCQFHPAYMHGTITVLASSSSSG